MKTQLKHYALSLFLVLAIIITNFFVYYTSVCNSEILQIKNTYGKVSSVNLASIQKRKQLILNLSNKNPAEVVQMLEKEIIVLEDYAAAVNYVQKQNNSALRRWSDLPYNERITYVERLYQDSPLSQ